MPCRKDYVRETKDPHEVVKCLEEKFGEDLSIDIFREQKAGKQNLTQFYELWMTIPRERFLELVDNLFELDFLHFHICSGNDDGETVSINYHFSLFRVAERGKRLGLSVTVHLPKED
ncbi:MAG TPA: NADH-quinone oxidoreductase subunit C, partial [Synergistales bacterium]|nr:NADH-quinone oxidoreductase subunit C [Synergistales bacterium]